MKLTRRQLRYLISESVNKIQKLKEAKWNREKRKYDMEDWDLRRAADYEVELADMGLNHKVYPAQAIQIGFDEYDFDDINFPYATRTGHQGQVEEWEWNPEEGWIRSI